MNTQDVVKWSISTLTAGITLVWGAYSVFDTRTEAKERHDQLSHYLELRLDQQKEALDLISIKIDIIKDKLNEKRRN